MSSWAHQTPSSRGKGDSKTCQAEGREGACFSGPGGLGSWERSQTDEHWEEECLLSLSFGASAPRSNAGLRLALEGLSLGLEGLGRPSPQASRPSAQLVWGPPPPPVPWELGVGGGGNKPPLSLPGQLLQNLPAPTFHLLLKGKLLLPNSACPKPCRWVEEKTPAREAR